MPHHGYSTSQTQISLLRDCVADCVLLCGHSQKLSPSSYHEGLEKIFSELCIHVELSQSCINTHALIGDSNYYRESG